MLLTQIIGEVEKKLAGRPSVREQHIRDTIEVSQLLHLSLLALTA
jgi:hypothetical protein